MKFNARELELLLGMAEGYLRHVEISSRLIANKRTASQRACDLERVALLNRIIREGEADDE